MFPNESTAGLATGWRLSASSTPISQAHESLVCAPLSITSSPAVAPSGTLAITNESEPIITGAPTSPMSTRGRSVLANPLPRICNSPPAMAAGGVTCAICGFGSADFLIGITQIVASGEVKIPCHKQDQGGIDARHQIVRVNPPTPRQPLQLPHGPGLPDIERPEQGEGGDVSSGRKIPRTGERDPLPKHFIDDHNLRVFELEGIGRNGGGPDSGKKPYNNQSQVVPPHEPCLFMQQDTDQHGRK